MNTIEKLDRYFERTIQIKTIGLFKILLGNIIMIAAIQNLYIPSKITEGGILGITILLNKLFAINIALSGFVIDIILYFIAYLLLGDKYIRRTLFATSSFAIIYEILNRIGPIISPFEANIFTSILSGFCLGIGCGIIVSQGAAVSGDDNFAIIMNKFTPLPITAAYFMSDAVVLLISLFTYLPLNNVFLSFLATLTSSFTIGRFQIEIADLQKKCKKK